MDHLCRELAPIGDEAWKQIEDEARRTLKHTLSARKLVDYNGPHGWGLSSVDLGMARRIGANVPGTQASLRTTQTLVEIRVPFKLGRAQIEAIGRGADAPNLGAVTAAARRAAEAEDRAVFDGHEEAGIYGLMGIGADHGLTLSTDYQRYPEIVAAALTRLRRNGVDGPYSIALGPRCFEGLTDTTNRGGYPVMKLVQQQLDGDIVWAETLDGALVLSKRGGDFELRVGQDFSLGYERHDTDSVELYIEESFTLLARTPEALVPLRYPPMPSAENGR